MDAVDDEEQVSDESQMSVRERVSVREGMWRVVVDSRKMKVCDGMSGQVRSEREG